MDMSRRAHLLHGVQQKLVLPKSMQLLMLILECQATSKLWFKKSRKLANTSATKRKPNKERKKAMKKRKLEMDKCQESS